ncbi:MAG: hypothetical protein RJA56_1546 [Pseudomonadota bacterium]
MGAWLTACTKAKRMACNCSSGVPGERVGKACAQAPPAVNKAISKTPRAWLLMRKRMTLSNMVLIRWRMAISGC